MASPKNKDYLLGHVPPSQENPRLDTQHERITHGIMKGRLVHESVFLDKLDGPVADLCCGTGVWLSDLSKHFKEQNLPETDFIGFDLNPAAFRGNDQLAENVQLVQHDCVKPFDPEHIGKFGLVNMRGLTYAIPKGQLSDLFRNAVSLLKPGGYLHWLDTESQLWQSSPASADFDKALAMISRERYERDLVHYMPDFMLQQYLNLNREVPAPSLTKRPLSLLHFGLTPGGAARPGTSHEKYLNSCFSETVSETLELLLKGFLVRTQQRSDPDDALVSELERLIGFVADARKSKDAIVSGFFPLLVAQKASK